MPRSAEHNEIIRAARRDQILRAAGRVFAKKGFTATKIADIATEAGLSHGLLYHYFRSKEAVYAALLEEMVEQKPTRAELVGAARTGMERVERTLRRWLERVTARPELALLVAQSFLADTLPPATRSTFLRFARDGYRHLVTDLAAAQREGAVTRSVSAEELAVTLISTVRGLALVRFAYAAVSPVHATPSLETILRVVRVEGGEARKLAPRRRSTSEVGLRAGVGSAAAGPVGRERSRGGRASRA